ncbi:hypothetical protein GBAR_LOCUS6056 [Geodia barretti]|uniref:Uncharacterized protein n=1 Tax=Geodia barretti TaxID=519541 RepID=A0AA35WD41_GEOBA|nr:hypothetical protein GBAR_LOCUS6056 [Geodia barretti]
MWRSIAAGCLLLCAAQFAWSLGEYSRTASYDDQIVVRCTDKLKGTIQLLQQNTDLWHVGQDTVDLRMARRTFARVQQYIPECRVLIDNVEEHIQQAEAEMFPARLQEEEVWAQSVLESVLNTKASLAECQAAIENWEKARFQEGTNAWFQEYHTYDAIVMWYQKEAEEHPNLVRYVRV